MFLLNKTMLIANGMKVFVKMKTILSGFFLLVTLCVSAQTSVVEEEIQLYGDTLDIVDTTRIELVRISPEPFYDFLQFDFKVHDGEEHTVKIYIINSQHELVFFEMVQVYEGHERIRISTIDFFMVGLYAIQIKIDGKYQMFRSFKRSRY
ncbi:MAG: hypothetical protein KIS94_08510 [Chitinophagales bacterium]|nr:hypothetical protein [Chitinophagales bacterium]